MTFAWQGFCIEHPEDWSPVVLAGDRKAGYARIASAGRLALHVRWLSAKQSDLRRSLGLYLDRLARDAAKQKVQFSRDVEEKGDRLIYTYKGGTQGRGVAFRGQAQRTYFVETIGGRSDSLLSLHKGHFASFEECPPNFDRWALYGLDVMIPFATQLRGKSLQSGRTRIDLASRFAKIRVERWAFAEQLLAKHPLEHWALGVLGGKPVKVTQDTCGLHAVYRSLWGQHREAIVTQQPDRNQLMVVDCRYRKDTGRPSWDWLT